jgi:hypothetical protein
MTINFKANNNLMAIKQGNSFGDQIILVVDISKDASKAQRAAHPYVAGRIVYSETNVEGNHQAFTEQRLIKAMCA